MSESNEPRNWLLDCCGQLHNEVHRGIPPSEGRAIGYLAEAIALGLLYVGDAIAKAKKVQA